MNNPNGGGVLPNLPSASSTPSLPNVGEVLDPEIEELWSSRALLLVLLLLILSFWVSYYLKVHRIRSIHETIVAMFSGMLVGALVRLSPGHVVQDMIAFKSTILLNVLLPPIILNSGYSLKQESFFKSFAVILTFAFAGTFISAVALGVIVYLYSLLGLEGLSLTIIECLLFGSTLSATDPVTILAIFNALHVDPKLYSVIFGESLLNDAVAIVMFETLSQFHGEKIHVLSFFHGVGIFLLTFFISMALGVLFGLSCSLMLKHSELGRYTEIEACLVFLIAYTSYFFSNALTMSGIVSLLFCGITLKHYAYHNMSLRTQRSSRYMFGSLASLSENFVFIYLGLSLFTQTELVYKPIFIIITFVAMCIARYSAVFPISRLVNAVFRARGARVDEIPPPFQTVLFFAGLRGAVGVALAEGFKGTNAIALRTTVLVSVVLTVVVFGGTIGRVIEVVGIRTGMVDEDDDETDEEYEYLADQDQESRLHRKKDSLAHGTPGTSHHFATMAGRSFGGGGLPANADFDDLDTSTSSITRSSSSFRGTGGSSSRLAAGRTSISPSSSASEDSDPDLLPSPTDKVSRPGGLGAAWSTLDESYLLPVFSQPTAARNKEAKKKKRLSRSPAQEEGSSPYASGGEGNNKSLADIVGALVAPALGGGSLSDSSSRLPMTPHLYANPSSPYPSTDLTAATSARDRGHTPSGSYSNSSGSAAAVKPFGGRRSSGRGESPGGEGGRRS